jgi:pimeloyl-ACP methyl ester carboxylesterase
MSADKVEDSRPTADDVRSFDWTAMTQDVRRGTFDAPSGCLATAEWGPPEGITVLALPGVTGSKEDFALVAPVLAHDGYRVISADLAGQYESHAAGPNPAAAWSVTHPADAAPEDHASTGEDTARATGRFDLALHVADAEALLDAYGPAHVIGYSFAGQVAVQLAVRRAPSVRSLTLISAPPVPGNALAKVRIIGPLAHVIGPKFASRLMRWGIARNLNHMPENRIALVRHRFEFTSLPSIVDAMAEMMHVTDVEDELRASGVPVLVAVGRGDLWSAKRHRAYAARIGAQVREYATGHAPMETRPQEMATGLSAFLAAIDQRKESGRA